MKTSCPIIFAILFLTHTAIIVKYEDSLSIIRFDYNRVAVHLLVCVFMVLIPLRFDYNRYSTNSSVSIIIFQFHKGSIITAHDHGAVLQQVISIPLRLNYNGA